MAPLKESCRILRQSYSLFSHNIYIQIIAYIDLNFYQVLAHNLKTVILLATRFICIQISHNYVSSIQLLTVIQQSLLIDIKDNEKSQIQAQKGCANRTL